VRDFENLGFVSAKYYTVCWERSQSNGLGDLLVDVVAIIVRNLDITEHFDGAGGRWMHNEQFRKWKPRRFVKHARHILPHSFPIKSLETRQMTKGRHAIIAVGLMITQFGSIEMGWRRPEGAFPGTEQIELRKHFHSHGVFWSILS
jgi:hypothetical protein